MQATIAEAALRLRVSEQTIRRRIKSGELPSIQVDTPQGFIWVVELPDGYPSDNLEHGEVTVLRELVETLKSQVDNQNRQIEQLHVLLQQAQAALPAPRNGRPWWRWWRRD